MKGYYVALTLVVGLLILSPRPLDATPINLGSASQFAVLSLGGQLVINGGNTTDIIGDIGVVAPGPLKINKSTITGRVFIQPNTEVVLGGDTNVTLADLIINEALLDQAKIDAIALATSSSMLLCSTSFSALCGTSITSSVTLVAVPGETNVINLTGINLNHASLTLRGDSTSSFVINVEPGGDFQFSHAQVILDGLAPNEVLFNVQGQNGSVLIHKEDTVFRGILLSPDRDRIDIQDDGMVFYGSVIGSNLNTYDTKFVIHSGADLVHEVPEPASLLLLGLGLFVLAGCQWRQGRKEVSSHP